jgi:hypothetical protein
MSASKKIKRQLGQNLRRFDTRNTKSGRIAGFLFLIIAVLFLIVIIVGIISSAR